MSLKSILTEIKQRLIKLETVHGLYFVPLGILGIYFLFFQLQHVIQVAAAIGFLFVIIEGLRKIFYNPIKKEALKVVNRNAYIQEKQLVPPRVITVNNVSGTTVVSPNPTQPVGTSTAPDNQSSSANGVATTVSPNPSLNVSPATNAKTN